ncbi:MAG: efflux RND transporter permease subunit [Treponema sp.]|jgi:HAE1 family hydrophobic/amphiphilic exporter-1|nr:efflux RND transporter permease subunit [Treponema sp.]
MSFTKLVVSRPTTIFIVFALLIMLGVFAFVNLPIDLMPEISPPYLVVYATYAGAGPEEVERSVTRVLEGALSSVSSLEKVTSTSSKDSSMVMMEFTYGTDLIDASNSIRDSLERVRNVLPSGADTPTIFRFDPAMLPIMSFMVTGNRSPEELREIAESTIVPRFEQVPGVATVSLSGGRQKIIRVDVPQNRLEAYGLTISDIQRGLAVNNQQVSAGTIIDRDTAFLLMTQGEYTSLDQINNTVIAYKGGGASAAGVEAPKAIRLRDIADIYEGYRDETSVVYVNGQTAVMLQVQKQSGKNSVQTAKDLRSRLTKIAAEVPMDIKITELSNTTDIIENSISQVGSSAFMGMVLAIIILFVFLRSIKPTLIIGISIPVSIVVTLMLMYFAKLTLNIMTLAGLVLGVGMLVDNSIVILENIYHYREKGAKLATASVIGTQEMIVAIVASTLTTICVFAPLVMFQGLLEIAGEMFAGLAFTVVISLASSLFVAIFLVPVLASHYLPLVTRKQKPLRGFLGPIDRAFERFFDGLGNAYRRAVDWVLRHKFLTVSVMLLLFVGSILMIGVIGWIFMPAQEADNVTVNITLPLGTPLEETESTLYRIQSIVEQKISGYSQLVLRAGGGGMLSSGGTNTGSLEIRLLPYEQRIMSADEITAVIRGHVNEFPGAVFSFGGAISLGSGNAVDIVLHVDDMAKGKTLAERIVTLLEEKVPEVTEPRIDLQDGLPQIEIQLDRERIYALGLTTMTIGSEIRAAVDGVVATRYKSEGHDYDVLLCLMREDRSTLPSLDHIFVNSQLTGGRVPLSSFASYVESTGPMSINRENQSRTIHITGGSAPGVTSNAVDQKVRSLIAQEIPQDDEVIIEFAGDNAEMVDLFVKFLLIVVVAIALVFGIMASLFESFRDPFIILFTIPLSLIGIVIIYFITNDVFNIITAVGLLVLVGVIVNNGIVLVDYTNTLRKRGLSLHDACVEAAGNRLRPILMTTLTTVLGLVPMAFFPGEGSEFVAPIGKTVLGGLSFGTLMTLFLMPAIYYIFNRHSDERAARAQARREEIAAGLPHRQEKHRLKAKDHVAASLGEVL